MCIGSQIQLYRRQSGLTQEALAAEMGVSIAAVSKWETGNSMPDIVMLCALADFFKISTDELLGRSGKNRDVIICDDAAFMRETLSGILAGEGFRSVRTAENGRQLLDAVEEKTPHAVFLDVLLPDADGVELLRSIKEKDRDIKVIMVTADNSEETVGKATEYGADAFITKPFLPEHIKIAVNKHIAAV